MEEIFFGGLVLIGFGLTCLLFQLRFLFHILGAACVVGGVYLALQAQHNLEQQKQNIFSQNNSRLERRVRQDTYAFDEIVYKGLAIGSWGEKEVNGDTVLEFKCQNGDVIEITP